MTQKNTNDKKLKGLEELFYTIRDIQDDNPARDNYHVFVDGYRIGGIEINDINKTVNFTTTDKLPTLEDEIGE